MTRLLETRRSEGAEILDLTVSNPTRVGLDYPGEEILASLASPASLVYEPAPQGLDTARSAVASYYAARGSRVETRDLVLTTSTSEAYGFLFKLLTEPGHQILAPAPSYPLFEYLALSESLQCLHYPLVYDGGWRVDFDRLAPLFSASAKALLLVHPNNPTGSLIQPEEWERLLELCKPSGVPVICDEVFLDYRLTEAPWADFLTETEVPVYVLNGLSKISALPQMKLAWILLRGEDAVKQESRERLEILADTYLSVGTPVQHALPKLLEIRTILQGQILERLGVNLQVEQSLLEGTAASPLAVEAGWYSVLRLPSVISEEEWVLRLLEEHNTLVHPGYFYDFPEPCFLILSLLTPPEVLTEGLGRLRELLTRVCA